jgi:hypothetical protein
LFEKRLLPIELKDRVLSVTPVVPVVVNATPFTVNEQTLVDVRKLATTVNHEFCTIVPVAVAEFGVFVSSKYKVGAEAYLFN